MTNDSRNSRPAPDSPRPRHRRRRRRAGTVYLLVLGLGMLVAVIGMGALAAARAAARASSDAGDWQEADTLAFSAVEHALSVMNERGMTLPSSWRTGYTSGVATTPLSLGAGTISHMVVDEADGNFTNSYFDSFRLYGIAKVGAATRVYSVLVNPAGSGLDVLRTAAHSTAGINSNNTVLAIDGPLSTDKTLFYVGTIRGEAEAKTRVGLGTITGGFTTSAVKTMPSPQVFNTYKERATTITWSSFDPYNTGTFQPYLLTAGYNANGATNPDGIYYVKIPATVAVAQINASRIKGTLLVDGTTSSFQQLTIAGQVNWEPHRTDLPALIVRGCNTVVFNGAMGPLKESSISRNLNPVGSAFNLLENVTTDDVYPSEIRGLIHVIGSNNVYIGNNFYHRGPLLADGMLQFNGFTHCLVADPSIQFKPPPGYARGDAVVPVAGTWKWDALP